MFLILMLKMKIRTQERSILIFSNTDELVFISEPDLVFLDSHRPNIALSVLDVKSRRLVYRTSILVGHRSRGPGFKSKLAYA